MDGNEDTLGKPMAEGYRAHRAGLLLAECPYGRNKGHRRLWRAGWMEREESYLRASRATGIRLQGGVL